MAVPCRDDRNENDVQAARITQQAKMIAMPTFINTVPTKAPSCNLTMPIMTRTIPATTAKWY